MCNTFNYISLNPYGNEIDTIIIFIFADDKMKEEQHEIIRLR